MSANIIRMAEERQDWKKKTESAEKKTEKLRSIIQQMQQQGRKVPPGMVNTVESGYSDSHGGHEGDESDYSDEEGEEEEELSDASRASSIARSSHGRSSSWASQSANTSSNRSSPSVNTVSSRKPVPPPSSPRKSPRKSLTSRRPMAAPRQSSKSSMVSTLRFKTSPSCTSTSSPSFGPGPVIFFSNGHLRASPAKSAIPLSSS
ncbi:unnamed protein product [Fusarium graminearum]|nr:unnamed protein product [Fusarium graminearum]